MSRATNKAIVITDLGFSWPDGQPLFTELSFAVDAGRSGLIGNNGSGKSTLLRLIAGELTSQQGSVQVAGKLGYLPQDFTLAADLSVAEVLGIAPAVQAIRAVEDGHGTEEHFAIIGDDWNIDERARATLDRLGLVNIELNRNVGEISGGEAILLGLAAQFIQRPAVLLLDEPTNNLDQKARHRLYDSVLNWSGVLLVVSHDRELLMLLDQIGDLRDGEVRWYGGNFADYEQAVAVEQEAAQRMVRVAESVVRREQRDLNAARITVSRRSRYGQKMWDTKREPKVVMAARKRAAQVSTGKHLNTHLEKLREAREQLADANETIIDDDEIRIDLPDTTVPTKRTVLTTQDAVLRCGAHIQLAIRGPERMALLGANGSGKTTLLDTIAGIIAPAAGSVRPAVPLRYLPQRLSILNNELSIIDNVATFAPHASNNTIRAQLARFLFSGNRAHLPVRTLSGGERFRASLAALLLADPAPQLLLLDEPTNNLDLASVDQLTTALSNYHGALLVASHDLSFLHSLGITRWLRLEGELNEIDPPPLSGLESKTPPP